jgi:ABC-2 type transport system permease protein
VGESARLRRAVHRDVRAALLLARARVRGELQYRTSFALLAAAQLFVTVSDLVAILAIFTKVPTLGGWSRDQVVVLYGVTTTAFALADVTASGVSLVAEWVRAGRFDRLLLRPAGALAQLLGQEFQLRRVGRLPQPLVALAAGLVLADVRPSARNVVLLAGAVAGAWLLFVALFVLTSSLAFWSPDTEEVAAAFTFGGMTASQYPANLFGDWLRRWLFSIVPTGFVCYAPVMTVVGAPDPLALPGWVAFAGPLAAVPFAVAAAAAWRAGTRHHTSTGS